MEEVKFREVSMVLCGILTGVFIGGISIFLSDTEPPARVYYNPDCATFFIGKEDASRVEFVNQPIICPPNNN